MRRNLPQTSPGLRRCPVARRGGEVGIDAWGAGTATGKLRIIRSSAPPFVSPLDAGVGTSCRERKSGIVLLPATAAILPHPFDFDTSRCPGMSGLTPVQRAARAGRCTPTGGLWRSMRHAPKPALLGLMLAVSFSLCAGEGVIVSDSLLDAIEQVESSGRGAATPDGDEGRAIGPFQIWRDYWTDAMDWTGDDWPYEDARDPARARYAVCAYLDRYGRNYRRITGKEPTDAVLSQIHHSGPRGWESKDAARYWRKVREAMEASP